MIARTLPIALALAALACGAGGGDAVGTSEEEALRAAHAPIPQVLQYVGAYAGDGSFQSLELRRNGTFVATIAGQQKAGRYEGPRAPAEIVKIALITRGSSYTVTVPSDWTPKQRLDVAHAGATETLTSAWDAGSETICDASGGDWTDDDPDPKTGLYCLCHAPKEYIPSLGGCVR